MFDWADTSLRLLLLKSSMIRQYLSISTSTISILGNSVGEGADEYFSQQNTGQISEKCFSLDSYLHVCVIQLRAQKVLKLESKKQMIELAQTYFNNLRNHPMLDVTMGELSLL